MTKVVEKDAERHALVAFYRATHGESWREKKGWCTDASLSEWHGVKVSEGRVVELNLHSNNLQGSIPKELGQLGALKELLLHFNQLTGSIPKELGQLCALSGLRLFNNKLEGSIPKELGQLGALEYLDLSTNKLEGSIPKELGKLRALESLYLDDNQLTGSIPKELGHLGALYCLSLTRNHLKGSIPKGLGQLGALVFLKFTENELEGSIPKDLGQLGSLEVFDLSENKLEGSIPKELGKLSALTELALHHNQLEGSIPKELGHLDALTQLNLTTNRLKGSLPEELGQLGALEFLDLSQNELEGLIPKELGKLDHLGILDLSHNKLEGSIPQELRQLDALRQLDLSDNRLEGIIPENLSSLNGIQIHVHGNNINGHIPGDSESFIGRSSGTGFLRSRVEGPPCMKQMDEAFKRSGTTESWRVKVVLVGAVRAGKTSIIKGLMKGEPDLCDDDVRTKGVDVHTSTPLKASPQNKLEIVFWDFAGHSDYYSTHQLFLSQGAMHLLVIDIMRFAEEPLESRGDLVYSWLDALLCRVPGCSLVVVATQIDRLAGKDVELLKENLKGAVEKHIETKKREQERAFRNKPAGSWKPATLVFHGVETVSAADRDSLLSLRKRLFGLVMDKRKLFASVGTMVPVSVARASAALRAMLTGDDPSVEAWNVKPGNVVRDPCHRKSGIPYLTWEQASTKWNDVVKALNLEDETGVADDVLKAAIELQVRQGMVLESSGLIYLDPTWINRLLRAILDHDLQDPRKENFWLNELDNFVDLRHVEFYGLKRIHDRFCATGTLTVDYLRFLWRDIIQNGMDPSGDLFWCLLDTMSQHGIIFKSSIATSGSVDVDHGLEDAQNLFMPVRLPPRIIEDDLLQCETQKQNQYREDLIYDIYGQSYVPPGVLGPLIADFIRHSDVELHVCWSRGASFTMGGPVVLLHLGSASEQRRNNAVITANIFGQKLSGDLFRTRQIVEKAIKDLFAARFPGIRLALRGGKPHPVEREAAALEKIEALKTHIDYQISRLLRVLGALEGKMDEVAESSRANLARLTKLQSKDYPYPALVIVRSASAVSHGSGKRTLRSWFKAKSCQAKSAFIKDARLCFLCPYDLSEVPCGLDGNGYKFGQTRGWVKALKPALQVAAVIASIAVKAGTGLTLPVSDFLNSMMEGVVEKVADDLECKVLEALKATESDLANPQPVGGKPLAELVGAAYENLKQFMEKHNSSCTNTNCIHFKNKMERVDDGSGGQVWISKVNAQQWRDSI